MSTNISLSYQDGYVLAQFAPDYQMMPDELTAVWAEMSALCKAHNCSKLLCVGARVRHRFSMTDVFNVGLKLVENGVGMTIALVFREYQITEVTRFFEVVTGNRGVRIRFFNDVEAGLAWLMADRR